MSAAETLSERALNRALLARQGLLERTSAPLVELVESIGAMQGQAWGALPVGLASRLEHFAPEDLYDALRRRKLLWGIGIRGTLHLVSAREHPYYAVLAAEGWTRSWQRKLPRTTPAMDELRAELLAFATRTPRTNEEIREFVEAWVEAHPRAIEAEEVKAQRALGWRPIYRWSALTRVPQNGEWGSKAPADHLAAPVAPGARRAPAPKTALERAVRFHLRAFGPAAAEDVACWTGARAGTVRETLERTAAKLVRLEDEHGRTLYDLPDAPRPDPDTLAPPRLLGAFDSTLLAYEAKRRERIVPRALRDAVYQKANLQIKPTLLIDGFVAGTWSLQAKAGRVSATLRPAGRVARGVRDELGEEAERLLRALHPDAKSHTVAFE